MDGALHGGLDAFKAAVLEIANDGHAPYSKCAVDDSKFT